ncbi:MAG TPA: hypothetical protein V6D22_10360 [Candidatus Obscuribacterales bacterium]
MRDCPACRVPLHGYEEVCPSCGTRQRPTKSAPYGSGWKPEEPRVNVVPFVLVFLGVVVFLLFAMQGTWIGQLMRQAPVQEDPIAKMSFSDARTIIDSKIQENLAAVGAKNSKVTWHNPSSAPQASGQVDDRAVDAPIELTIDTTLPTPDVRKQVVDPIKPYMEKAKLYTLSMNDAKSHAHWTYTMTPGVTPSDADE